MIVKLGEIVLVDNGIVSKKNQHLYYIVHCTNKLFCTYLRLTYLITIRNRFSINHKPKKYKLALLILLFISYCMKLIIRAWPLILDLYVALNPLYRMFVLLVDTKMMLIELLVEFTVNFCKLPQYFPISEDCRINPSLIYNKQSTNHNQWILTQSYSYNAQQV